MKEDRLQKILARAGYGSRRACEKLIAEGRVAVDGKIATLGDKADPGRQTITLDGVPIQAAPQTYIYIMLHKPRGVISTVSDPHGRTTVRDLVPVEERVYPVGRLDAQSEGLILLTNDGKLTERLTHPRYEHPRVYRVLVRGNVAPETLDRWRRGITLDGIYTRCDEVKVESQQQDETWLRITVHEGRKHLVRRIVAALGHPARRLIRVGMGPLRLGKLPPGKWRRLRPDEIEALNREVSQTTSSGQSSSSGRLDSSGRSPDRARRPGRSKRSSKSHKKRRKR
ncbi:MAG: pseudouridine synthase [Anaerolineae bacterium]